MKRPEREGDMHGPPLQVQNNVRLGWSELAYISRPQTMV
jgi:hypothetical protein